MFMGSSVQNKIIWNVVSNGRLRDKENESSE